MLIKRNIMNFIFHQSLKKRRRSALFIICIAIGCTTIAVLYCLLRWNNDPMAIKQPFIYIEPMSSYFRTKHRNATKDWHNYELIKLEAQRQGPGEQGQPVFLAKEEEELGLKIFEENKHNGLASDKIARDRSIPDTRPHECRHRQYLKELPSVSVVIPFHNEILSTLTRTIHSIFTRSQPELLKEIILVNDHSDKEYCYRPLEEYIEQHFDVSKIRILVLPERSGLIWARLAGARASSGEVIVFMDCHTEANVNWLPPLIEPIAKNYRTCVCPSIDNINAKTYAYTETQQTRGAFNWQFYFQFMPLRPGDQESKSDPYQSPVMMGCAFAISAKFFWELGGFDTGLDIWGGEQYELSFKVWLCGGEQLDTPCSRIGHLYRPRPFTIVENRADYYSKNYKRVAEVWMDEYKQGVYDGNPEHWNKVDAGDLSYALNLKKKLNCKPFSYFLEHVAPDLLDRYPPFKPPAFCLGAVQSVERPDLCIDTLNVKKGESLNLSPCRGNLMKPGGRQNFRLRNHRDVSIGDLESDCLEVKSGNLTVNECKFNQGNQYFRYDLETQQIFCGTKRNNQCIDMDPTLKTVFVAPCAAHKKTQMWIWGFTNETMLSDWANYGKEILDKGELADMTK